MNPNAANTNFCVLRYRSHQGFQLNIDGIRGLRNVKVEVSQQAKEGLSALVRRVGSSVTTTKATGQSPAVVLTQALLGDFQKIRVDLHLLEA